MTRKCFRCPELATNSMTATIAVCDNCWKAILDEVIMKSLEKGRLGPILVSPAQYKAVEFIQNRKKK